MQISKMPPKLRKTSDKVSKRLRHETNLNERETVPVPPAAKKRKTKNLSRAPSRSDSDSDNLSSSSQPHSPSPVQCQHGNHRFHSTSSFDKYLQVRYLVMNCN